MTQRDHWSGKLGFVLAAAGSAIGLGNLWKFPYITWDNGGGTFVLVYLGAIALVGLPLMAAEILLGRRAQTSVSTCFRTLGHRRFGAIGALGVLSSVVILGFYSVIAGWSLRSFGQCLSWSISGYEAPPESAFGEFLANPYWQLGLGLAFSVLTASIVIGGVSRGIERAAKILMPALAVILVYLLVTAMGMDGFSRALRFTFASSEKPLSQHAILEALGHAFFTLSLGMGAMITYGSYVQRSERVVPIALAVVILDTLIALTACLILFTIIFSIPGVESRVSRSTVGMLFVTLPRLFYTEMSGGVVIGPVFYLLVAFAALTSTISLLEVTVSFFADRWGFRRVTATITATVLVYALTVLSGLSLGASSFLSELEILGGAKAGALGWLERTLTGEKAGVLAILDHVSANWLLPLGGLLISVFVGWVLPRRVSLEELAPGRETPPAWYRVWLFLVRYVVPLSIGWIIVSVLLGEDFS